jgi:hypothetical protein
MRQVLARVGAIGTGLLCFIVIYFGLLPRATTARVAPSVVTLIFWGMVLVPGFVVGAIGRTSPIGNGLVLGALIALTVGVPSLVFLIRGVPSPVHAPTHSTIGIVTGAVMLVFLSVVLMVACWIGALLGAAVVRKLRGS